MVSPTKNVHYTLFLCLIETEVNRGVALAAYRWAAYGG